MVSNGSMWEEERFLESQMRPLSGLSFLICHQRDGTTGPPKCSWGTSDEPKYLPLQQQGLRSDHRGHPSPPALALTVRARSPAAPETKAGARPPGTSPFPVP